MISQVPSASDSCRGGKYILTNIKQMQQILMKKININRLRIKQMDEKNEIMRQLREEPGRIITGMIRQK